MPRNPSGVYAPPAGTFAVAGTTIESAKFNAFVQDMVADLNLDRPVAAGGTGASTSADARVNLGLAGLIGALPEVTAANALNTIDSQGWVFVSDDNDTVVGGPDVGAGAVYTGYTAGLRVQIYHPIAALAPRRRSYRDGNWTAWIADWESGVSGGNRFYREASGRQQCVIEGVTLEYTSATNVGAVVTFPAAFIDTNYVVAASLRGATDGTPTNSFAASATPGASMILPPVTGGKTTTTCTVRCFKVAGATDFLSNDKLYVDLTVTGRWFL